MTRFRYSMDFGAGYILIDIFNNNLAHVVVRDVSAFTTRTALEGSFDMEISNFADLPDFVETSEVIPFKFEEDQNLGGSPDWVTIFDGQAHLRGEIDWVKGMINIFDFEKLDGKLQGFLRIWKIEIPWIVNSQDHDIDITDGTTTHTHVAIGANLLDHIDGDLSSVGMSELTTMPTSLPFDYSKLDTFPTRTFDTTIPHGRVTDFMFTLEEELQLFEDLFQIFWYIDESIPAASKLIFYKPDDDPISRLVLDGAYVNAVVSDIGKTVLDDGGDTGSLIDYDNTNKVWWIRMNNATDVIADNSVMTISTGTGAGDASGTSDNSMFYSTSQINIESEVTNIRRDKYKRSTMVWKENFKFLNEKDDADFIGFPLRYPNETKEQVDYKFNITTNLFGAAADFAGGSSSDVDGLSVAWGVLSGNIFTTDTGTGIISSATISNEYLSKARLHVNWFKTNRYHIRSGIYINDSLISLADDAIEKHIRDFPDYKVVLSALPMQIGTLRWEFDSPNELIALIVRCETKLSDGITVYQSRQLKSWLT